MTEIIDLSGFSSIDVYHASDAHNEHTIWRKPDVSTHTYYPKPVEQADDLGSILLISGDMLRFRRFSLNIKWLEEVAREFTAVCYVFGNHEFYDSLLEKPMRKLKEKTAHLDNLFLLENEDVVFKLHDSEMAVIGATFWMDFDPTMNGSKIEETMSRVGYYHDRFNYEFTDFAKIRHKKGEGYARIRPGVLRSKHLESKKYIFEAASKHKSHGRKVLVLTHHSPSYFSATHFDETCWLQDRFREHVVDGSLMRFAADDIERLESTPFEWGTPMYCSRLEEDLLSSDIDYWGHGHLHASKRYMIGETEIDNNPQGYYTSRNKNFRSGPWFRWGEKNAD